MAIAGVTQPSPLDVREIGDDSRLATIFGRDPFGMPHKWTLVCKDMESCKNLISSVNAIVSEFELKALKIGSNRSKQNAIYGSSVSHRRSSTTATFVEGSRHDGNEVHAPDNRRKSC